MVLSRAPVGFQGPPHRFTWRIRRTASEPHFGVRGRAAAKAIPRRWVTRVTVFFGEGLSFARSLTTRAQPDLSRDGVNYITSPRPAVDRRQVVS